jgi:transposase
MRYETFIRCILRCLENIGGVPWVLVFDNTKTVAKGRKDDGNPVWNPKFRQFAMVICGDKPAWVICGDKPAWVICGDKPACHEIGFHPDVCALPNQKGTVENGVSFVKGNFLPGRTFLDDGELKIQSWTWAVREYL